MAQADSHAAAQSGAGAAPLFALRDGALPLWRVLVAIGGVYVAQSLIGGVTFMGIPAVLRAEGAGLEQIGLVALLMLPWALKFLWSPLAERYRIRPDGTRRSRRLVGAGQMACAVLLAVLAFIGPQSVQVMFGVLALVATIAATVDIAADAFAVEQLAAENRGWGNTAQVGGGYLGMVLGGGLFLVLVPWVGWTVAMGVMALSMLVLATPFMLTPEPARTPPQEAHRPSLGFALRRPEVRAGLVIAVLFEGGVRLMQVLAGPFLVDRGLDLASIGLVNGIGGVIMGLTGTVLGGLLVRLAGAEKAVLVAAAAQALALALLAAGALLELPALPLAGLVMVKTMAMAMGFVTLYALLMGLSSLKQAGVDFTLFQCADAAVAGIAGFMAAGIAARFGYGVTFVAAAVVAVIGLLLLPLLIGRARAALHLKA